MLWFHFALTAATHGRVRFLHFMFAESTLGAIGFRTVRRLRALEVKSHPGFRQIGQVGLWFRHPTSSSVTPGAESPRGPVRVRGFGRRVVPRGELPGASLWWSCGWHTDRRRVERSAAAAAADQISRGSHWVRERFGGGGVEDLLGPGDRLHAEWDGGGREGGLPARHHTGPNIRSWKKYGVYKE